MRASSGAIHASHHHCTRVFAVRLYGVKFINHYRHLVCNSQEGVVVWVGGEALAPSRSTELLRTCAAGIVGDGGS
jgi:hypothetical protein